MTDEQLYEIIRISEAEGVKSLPPIDVLARQYPPPRRVKKRIEAALHRYDSAATPVVHIGRRVAIALLAALIAASVTLTVSAVAREWFFKVISEIFPTHTQIDYEPANSEQMELVFVPYAPTFLPDGYTAFDGPKIFSETRRVTVRYENENGGYISFSQTFSGGLNIDTEDAETELLQVSGHDAFYIRKGDWKSLNWEAENARFLLSVDDSSLDKDDIVAIAESIAPVTKNE